MTGRPRGDGGQAAVELALVLPLVALMLLAVVQVGVVVRDQVLLVHGAREAARAAAVSAASATEAETAARAASGLSPRQLVVHVAEQGQLVSVRLSYRSATDVPLVGSLVGDVTLRATATMRVET